MVAAASWAAFSVGKRGPHAFGFSAGPIKARRKYTRDVVASDVVDVVFCISVMACSGRRVACSALGFSPDDTCMRELTQSTERTAVCQGRSQHTIKVPPQVALSVLMRIVRLEPQAAGTIRCCRASDFVATMRSLPQDLGNPSSRKRESGVALMASSGSATCYSSQVAYVRHTGFCDIAKSGPPDMTYVARTLLGIACGAAAMYWLDPVGGRRRRAILRDKLTSVSIDLGEAIGVASRDLTYRTRGLGARVRAIFATDDVPDEVLAERVRSAIGRIVSHPGAIDVAAVNGMVRLSGSVLTSEHLTLVDVVSSVRGVDYVIDELAVYADGTGIPSLQGGKRRRPLGGYEHWSATKRLLAGTVGGTLIYTGARQYLGEHHRAVGALMGTAGGLLIVRSATNTPVLQLGRPAIEIRKALQVRAPVEKVFEVLARHEKLPGLMRNIRSVQRRPDGRSHWVLAGPAGLTIEWDAETTASKPNELLAWHTIGKTTLAHAGIIRFERAGEGTRIDIRITYNPPAGVLGHLVAKLFGLDPQTKLDEDLMRLKTFFDTGIPARDAAENWRVTPARYEARNSAQSAEYRPWVLSSAAPAAAWARGSGPERV